MIVAQGSIRSGAKASIRLEFVASRQETEVVQDCSLRVWDRSTRWYKIGFNGIWFSL